MPKIPNKHCIDTLISKDIGTNLNFLLVTYHDCKQKEKKEIK